MPAEKYVSLVVEGDRGHLAERLAELKQYNFVLARATGIKDAVEAVRSSMRLALIAIAENVSTEDALALISAVKEAQADLPVLWARESRSEPAPSAADALLVHPFDTPSLHAVCSRLLREAFYPDAVLKLLEESVRDVMLESFGTTCEPGEPCLKSTRSLGGELSSMIAFAGRGVEGHLLASGERQLFERLYRKVVSGDGLPGIVKAGDLCGELCNHVLGRIRQHFENETQAGGPARFDVSTPLLLQGANIVMRRLAGSPSLMQHFQTPLGGLFVEFCFDRIDPQLLGKSPVAAALKPGQIIFL